MVDMIGMHISYAIVKRSAYNPLLLCLLNYGFSGKKQQQLKTQDSG